MAEPTSAGSAPSFGSLMLGSCVVKMAPCRAGSNGIGRNRIEHGAFRTPSANNTVDAVLKTVDVY